jgi:hypothetical protein
MKKQHPHIIHPFYLFVKIYLNQLLPIEFTKFYENLSYVMRKNIQNPLIMRRISDIMYLKAIILPLKGLKRNIKFRREKFPSIIKVI